MSRAIEIDSQTDPPACFSSRLSAKLPTEGNWPEHDCLPMSAHPCNKVASRVAARLSRLNTDMERPERVESDKPDETLEGRPVQRRALLRSIAQLSWDSSGFSRDSPLSQSCQTPNMDRTAFRSGQFVVSEDDEGGLGKRCSQTRQLFLSTRSTPCS